MSFEENEYRTGFPKKCPTLRVEIVLAANCLGCEFHKQDERLYWRCDHAEYQNEPGVHFCLTCGIELCFGGAKGVKKNQYPYCGGSSDRCRRDREVKV
jgi:hypothetical protein